jgi:hypothetical protein
LGSGRWALALALAARRQSLTQSLRRLDTGHKKQQHNAELVGPFVACFFKSHAAQQRHWFGQLTTSHIKQQVVYPCNHAIKHGSKVKTKRLSFVASFSIHFEPRFEPLGWLCALYSFKRRVARGWSSVELECKDQGVLWHALPARESEAASWRHPTYRHWERDLTRTRERQNTRKTPVSKTEGIALLTQLRGPTEATVVPCLGTGPKAMQQHHRVTQFEL